MIKARRKVIKRSGGTIAKGQYYATECHGINIPRGADFGSEATIAVQGHFMLVDLKAQVSEDILATVLARASGEILRIAYSQNEVPTGATIVKTGVQEAPQTAAA